MKISYFSAEFLIHCFYREFLKSKNRRVNKDKTALEKCNPIEKSEREEKRN